MCMPDLLRQIAGGRFGLCQSKSGDARNHDVGRGRAGLLLCGARRISRFRSSLAALTVLAAVPLAARADVVYVKRSAPVGGDGSSWSNAFRTLVEALDAAGDGDSIWIASGTYAPPSSDLSVSFEVTIRGGFAGTETSPSERDIELNETVISPADAGDHETYMFYVTGDGVTLDGLVFSGMDSATNGRVLYVGDAVLRVVDCTFRDNALEYYAPVDVFLGSTVTFDRCTFENNSSRYGKSGGIYARNAGTTVLTIKNCAFIDNSSYYTGAIDTEADTCVVYNCLFADNYGELSAGAIRSGASSDTYTLIGNCTISANYGENGPGGLLLEDLLYSDVYNSIIWDNEGGLRDEEQEFICEYPSNAHFERCIIADWAGTAYSYYAVGDDDPLFRDPDTLDFRLGSGSPAIDAGDTRLTPPWLTVDLAGGRRRINSVAANTGVPAGAGGPIVDIGAYESPE